MSSNLTHPPSQIVQQWLSDLSLGTLASAAGAWPIVYGQQPDELTGRDNQIFVWDTEGLTQGRIAVSGKICESPGIQISLRCTSFDTGMAKMRTIATTLDAQSLTLVTVSSTDYTIYTFNRTTGILSLGTEMTTSRYRFSVNGTLSVRQN